MITLGNAAKTLHVSKGALSKAVAALSAPRDAERLLLTAPLGLALARPRRVVLAGGCFQNRLLTERVTDLLARDGFRVLTHRRVPPGDGGLAVGQIWAATLRLASG